MVANAALRFRPADSANRADKSGGANKRKDERNKAGAAPMGTVYILENGLPKAVRISVGITDNRHTELLGGELKEGAVVILEDRQAPVKKSGGSSTRLF